MGMKGVTKRAREALRLLGRTEEELLPGERPTADHEDGTVTLVFLDGSKVRCDPEQLKKEQEAREAAPKKEPVDPPADPPDTEEME